VPVVVFCIAEIDEGDEVAIGKNVYITRPDNFNQLRIFALNPPPHFMRLKISQSGSKT
jgi:hypothetical protein